MYKAIATVTSNDVQVNKSTFLGEDKDFALSFIEAMRTKFAHTKGDKVVLELRIEKVEEK